MSLRVAVQMDPMESIKIAGDSSFALMEAAQARGHSLFHYDVHTLAWESDGSARGKITAHGAPVTVQRVEGDHFTIGERRPIDLARDIDVVLMRQDPPFDLGYISAAFILDRLHGETLVVNDPREVVNAPEKMFVLDYAQFMPPTLIARTIDEVRDFQARHGAVVVKPLHGNGGKAIFRIGEDGTNLSALFEVFNQTWPEPHMVQPFLPEVAQGDKRIVLVDGEFAGAINRKPGEGEFRSNLAQGGYAEAAGLTPREEEICAAMAPELKRRGLVFVGIDVIGGKWLTEINVTSPTGIVAVDRFNGTDTAGLIWDAIERRHEV
ncbi:glutathione synthase [Qipengyuania sp. DY56-A-20]|jgi:glutathione synthase|uniref:Glutathione synthetase n=1 Tax=Qipengyuania benthica TaxID=3067651 RepID=A0ABT9H7F5_9SPHN|nr:glutathione synthase [Qipengyuania sp. DY56-A-20]MDP4539251.1 glutathione synthase [Qipengyuania sp. DY56-A-20]